MYINVNYIYTIMSTYRYHLVSICRHLLCTIYICLSLYSITILCKLCLYGGIKYFELNWKKLFYSDLLIYGWPFLSIPQTLTATSHFEAGLRSRRFNSRSKWNRLHVYTGFFEVDNSIQFNSKYFIPPYKHNLHRIVME